MPSAATDLRRLRKRELYARYADLQERAHACFDEDPSFEQANSKAAPLIEQADAIATEIVQRARRAARRAWRVAYAAGALIVVLLVWLAIQR